MILAAVRSQAKTRPIRRGTGGRQREARKQEQRNNKEIWRWSMSASSNTIDESYLTETSIEQFKDFMKFIGDNNLWDEVEQHLKADGIVNVVVSSRPIESIRRLITDKLLKAGRL